ncbi:MAG: DUF6882 domain-containing protein [Verrucomicrobiota bacterium]
MSPLDDMVCDNIGLIADYQIVLENILGAHSASLDRSNSTIEFHTDSGDSYSSKAQIIGSYVESSGKWTWAWGGYLNFFDNYSLEAAEAIKKIGKSSNIEMLTKRKIKVDKNKPWDFVIYGAALLKLPFYRILHKESEIFLLLENTDIVHQESPPISEFAARYQEAIRMTFIIQQRRALTSYANQHGYQILERDLYVTVLDSVGYQLIFEFDEYDIFKGLIDHIPSSKLQSSSQKSNSWDS